jgi:hypothetical protein
VIGLDGKHLPGVWLPITETEFLSITSRLRLFPQPVFDDNERQIGIVAKFKAQPVAFARFAGERSRFYARAW